MTSSATASIAEGTTAIYTATATDVTGTTLRYSLSGSDASLLTINSSTGVVSLISGYSNAGTKASYSFNVIAGDGTLNTTQAVAITILDVAPVFTSSATASLLEGTTNIYTAIATDAAAGTTVHYSLSGTDASLLTINSTTGVVSLASGVTNYAAKNSYSFNVVANDGGSLNTTQAVAVSITDVAPVFTSSATASLPEGSANIYTATATDAAVGTTVHYTLSGTDASLLTINSATGVVSLASGVTNYGIKNSYSFNVVANDGGNLNTTQAVSVPSRLRMWHRR